MKKDGIDNILWIQDCQYLRCWHFHEGNEKRLHVWKCYSSIQHARKRKRCQKSMKMKFADHLALMKSLQHSLKPKNLVEYKLVCWIESGEGVEMINPEWKEYKIIEMKTTRIESRRTKWERIQFLDKQADEVVPFGPSVLLFIEHNTIAFNPGYERHIGQHGTPRLVSTYLDFVSVLDC